MAFAPMPEAEVKEMFARNSKILDGLGTRAPPAWLQAKVEKEVVPSGKTVRENRIGAEQCRMLEGDVVASVTTDVKNVLADNAEQLKAILKEWGFAIVTNVVAPNELQDYEDMWRSDLVALTGSSTQPEHPRCVQEVHNNITKHGPTRWPSVNLFNDKFSEKRGLQHGLYAWRSRLNPNVRKIYALLEGTEDLVVGTDNIFFTPTDSEQAKDNHYWTHVDFNTNAPGCEHKCYQGILYTWSSECPSASTTVLWPKSHTSVFDTLMKDPMSKATPSQYIPFVRLEDAKTKEEFIALSKKMSRRVPVPAGALLLWDSRMSHQGWSNGKRLAAPVCWQPKSFRSEEARKRKLWMAATGIPSNHWATHGKVHTKLGEMLTQISPATTDASTPHTDVLLPMYSTIVPYGIKEEALRKWQAALPKLWRGSARDSAHRFDNVALVEPLMKEEVLEVL
eukprot:TRINITY_DN33327_c0_g1_i1.p1 TRINITY_DN33327_c0_g1~~TRINITY_DN33327_c0_g1_i1.p1  ORF type:complete len:465 (+),score=149.69 TRINITY_DN33327_c0_g1_i1:48-1397(+)